LGDSNQDGMDYHGAFERGAVWRMTWRGSKWVLLGEHDLDLLRKRLPIQDRQTRGLQIYSCFRNEMSKQVPRGQHEAKGSVSLRLLAMRESRGDGVPDVSQPRGPNPTQRSTRLKALGRGVVYQSDWSLHCTLSSLHLRGYPSGTGTRSRASRQKGQRRQQRKLCRSAPT